MEKEKRKKESEWKKKIKEMKKTARGKAILKLIGWGIFFFIILVFCLISSIMNPKPIEKPNIEIPTEKDESKEEENKKAEQILTEEKAKEIINELKNHTYDYEIKVTQKEITYTYSGHKEPNLETGYKESKEGIIKYIIDNTGTFQEIQGEKTPITNLYEGLDLNYMVWDNLFEQVGNIEYYLTEENENLVYHMASEIINIYLTMTKEHQVTNIKIIQEESEYTDSFIYDFEFKNRK